MQSKKTNAYEKHTQQLQTILYPMYQISYQYIVREEETDSVVGMVGILKCYESTKEAYICMIDGFVFHIQLLCYQSTLDWISDISLLLDTKNEFTDTWNTIQKDCDKNVSNLVDNDFKYIVFDDRSFLYDNSKNDIFIKDIVSSSNKFETFTNLLARTLYYLRFPITESFINDLATRVWIRDNNNNNNQTNALIASAFKRACMKLQLAQNTIYFNMLRKRNIIKKIQRAYLKSYYNPEYKICRNRLLRELNYLLCM